MSSATLSRRNASARRLRTLTAQISFLGVFYLSHVKEWKLVREFILEGGTS